MISLVTNVDSLISQQNLRVNEQFQSQTIQQLTSGYRINSSADDAAGLAVANAYRNNIAELNQGVRNANDGVSQLQIIDGGMSNISQILDRMKTLATESSSTTFTGDRTTLNNEFQSLVQEINRQAANIGMSAGGQYNTILNVYIGGGGKTQGNSLVSVDLSGASNQVDSNALGVASSSLLASGTIMGSIDLNSTANQTILAGAGATQVFTFNVAGGTSFTATVTGQAGGITVGDAVQQLNTVLSQHGLSASVDSTTGFLMISSSVAFTASAGAASAGNGLVASSDTAVNTAMYRVDQGSTTKPVNPFAGVASGDMEELTFTSGGSSITVDLTNANAGSVGTALQTLNTQLAALGISAVKGTGGDIEFQSASSFTVAKDHHGDSDGTTGAGAGVFAATNGGSAISEDGSAPSVSGSATGNSLNALIAVTDAVATLGLVQGKVGAGENMLNYAINLAQSQISSFSSAQSQIRDADVAAEAANLTKAQVLQQSSIAAMAQANAEPQAILALLQKM
jgi:flagellin